MTAGVMTTAAATTTAGDRPTRVAIVGGGCAAMAAAHALTSPELAGRFAVTVYQQGWRLGGKGASGRGPFARIEEHGLHVWMGFYENAFRLMRSVYAELGRDPATCRIATWRDAFFPAPHVGLAHEGESGDWTVWSAVFPPFPGLPGDPLGAGADNAFSVAGYLIRAAQATATLFRVAHGPHERAAAAQYADKPLAELVKMASDLARTALGAAATLVGLAERFEVATLLLRGLEAQVRAEPARAATPGTTIAVIERLLTGALALLGRLRLPQDATEPRRRAAEVVEVLLASQLGTLRAGVLQSPQGFDVLDEWDFVEWLEHNGASKQAAWSPFVRGLYSLMFAFEDGDCDKPRVAAGQMLRGCVRMFFGYRGAFFWKMRAGMGDIVFAPLYEVLRRRGVSFEFFHRLADLRLAPAGAEPHVAELRFLVQARTLDRQPYQPLIDVGGLPCWPSQPDWTQLEGGARHDAEGRDYESFWDRRHVATKELVVGRDFDFVLLAVGLGEIPHVCAQLIERDARWRQMTSRLKTVATQALQLWCTRSLPELGWERGSITMTGFVSPFDTWADMSYLLDEERWPAAARPTSLAYFCNVLDDAQVAAARPRDPGHPERVAETVWHNAEAFVARDLPRLWPALAGEAGAIRWEVLVDAAAGAHGPSRLRGQFVSANVNPTDRYSLCLPGTPRFRISPLDRSYDNFTIAGDWTSCGLNLGCVEAAVMSGLLAAHALSGHPRLPAIIGYDHP
jgi:uncharacterized protein with NAD-binding domain and iron-sulfur cluster